MHLLRLSHGRFYSLSGDHDNASNTDGLRAESWNQLPQIHPQRDPVKPRQEGSLHLFLPPQPQHSDMQQKRKTQEGE